MQIFLGMFFIGVPHDSAMKSKLAFKVLITEDKTYDIE
jgi:hypothetical protein